MWPFSGTDGDAVVHAVTDGDPDWVGPATDAVQAAIGAHFDARVRIGDPQGLHERVGVLAPETPHERAHDPERQQYDALEFIDVGLESLGPDGATPVLVTDVDLYHDRRNFVLGLASVDPCALVLSLYRLWDGDRRWSAVELDRVRKEAVKLYGWQLGGHRCDDRECVLAPTRVPEALDDQEERICERSRRSIGESHLQ